MPLTTTYHQVTWDHARLPGLVAAQRRRALPRHQEHPALAALGAGRRHGARPRGLRLSRDLRLAAAAPLPPLRAAERGARRPRHRRFGARARRSREPLPARPRARARGAAGGARSARHSADGERGRSARGRGYGLGERLVACVGTVQPRKRVERVIEAFVRARGAERGWELVIAGRLRPGYAPPWLGDLPPGVRWLGPLDDGGAARALRRGRDRRERVRVRGLRPHGARGDGRAGCAVIAPGGHLRPGGRRRGGGARGALRRGAARRRARPPAGRPGGASGRSASARAPACRGRSPGRRRRARTRRVYEEVLG